MKKVVQLTKEQADLLNEQSHNSNIAYYEVKEKAKGRPKKEEVKEETNED